MEATLMKLAGVISTAVLSLALGVTAPAFAQNQHEQEEEKAKPAGNEKKGQPARVAKQDEKNTHQDKNAKPEEKNARGEQPRAQEAKPQAQHGGGGRIPADRYKANFGREHSFRVSEGDYRNHRFEYGGYAFGFVGIWPGNWLYTQNVYVIEIDGVYYLCNPMYPGVNLELSFAL
jgi:hypothetical protein